MKIVLRISFFIFIILAFSCEEMGSFIINCSDCTEEEPQKAKLEIKLESIDQGQIILEIYEGNIEDSVLIGSFVTREHETTKSVTLNKKYTVVAKYYIRDNKYTAIDSTTPRVRYEKEQCEEPCYFVYNRRVDLRLITVK